VSNPTLTTDAHRRTNFIAADFMAVNMRQRS
jgi:hypothetical protein